MRHEAQPELDRAGSSAAGTAGHPLPKIDAGPVSLRLTGLRGCPMLPLSSIARTLHGLAPDPCWM